MYQKTVTLRGNTANQGHFAWHPGMHVSDLIPDKDSLITRNYWWKRAQMGLPAPEFEPLQKLSRICASPLLPRNCRDGSDPISWQQRNEQRRSEHRPAFPGVRRTELPARTRRCPARISPVPATITGTTRNLSAAQRAGSASLGAEQPTVFAGSHDHAH